MGGFVPPAGLNFLEQGKDVDCLDVGDWAFADVWEDKGLKALLLIEEGLLAEGTLLHLEPLTGEQFERVGLGGTLCLPPDARSVPISTSRRTSRRRSRATLRVISGYGPRESSFSRP